MVTDHPYRPVILPDIEEPAPVVDDPSEPHDYRGDGGLCQARSGTWQCGLSAGHSGGHAFSFGGAARPPNNDIRGVQESMSVLLDHLAPWPDGEPDPLPEPETAFDAFMRRDVLRDQRAKALAEHLESIRRELTLFAVTSQSASPDQHRALATLRMEISNAANAAGLLAQIEWRAANPVNVRGE